MFDRNLTCARIGLLYRPEYPKKPNERLKSRVFAIEWELDLIKDSVGWLRFEYDHKLIRVEVRFIFP